MLSRTLAAGGIDAELFDASAKFDSGETTLQLTLAPLANASRCDRLCGEESTNALENSHAS
jgi:hypothetical protein